MQAALEEGFESSLELALNALEHTLNRCHHAVKQGLLIVTLADHLVHFDEATVDHLE
ncbi:hypothetical protein D3C81_2077910 [compost metagenome]